MIRGVFFDLFGTLLVYGDMEKAWSDWLHYFHSSMQSCGLSMSRDEFSKACDRFFGKREPESDDTGLTIFEKRIKALSEDLNMSISENDIHSIANLIVGKWHEHVSLDGDAVSTIRRLKEDRIVGLVSNFDHPPHVRRCLTDCGLEDLFDTIVISGEEGVKKPDPGIFDRALAETGLNAGEVAYVGDAEVDIAAARAANMRPVLIQRGNEGSNKVALDFSAVPGKEASKNHLDVSIITSLPELINLIE